MSPEVRRAVFLVGAAGFAVLLIEGLSALPPSGRGVSALGTTLAAAGVHERRATNAVTAVVLDFRATDTLGEEFILFTSIVGGTLLLRNAKDAEEKAAKRARSSAPVRPSEAVRSWSVGLAAPTLVLGLSVIAHGHLTPGGGFQGGVLLGSALVLVKIGDGSLGLRSSGAELAAELLEGAATAGLVVLGMAGVVKGLPFLTNLLPLGTIGSLLSAGFLPLANLCIGLAVASGLALLFLDFREHTLFAEED